MKPITDEVTRKKFADALLRAAAQTHKEMGGVPPVLPLAPKVENGIGKIAEMWGLPPHRTTIRAVTEIADPRVANAQVKKIIENAVAVHNRIC